MPSATSSASEPVDMASTSMEAVPLPMRMIAPLPNWRSICVRAAVSACFLLSSTYRLLKPVVAPAGAGGCQDGIMT